MTFYFYKLPTHGNRIKHANSLPMYNAFSNDKSLFNLGLQAYSSKSIILLNYGNQTIIQFKENNKLVDNNKSRMLGCIYILFA